MLWQKQKLAIWRHKSKEEEERKMRRTEKKKREGSNRGIEKRKRR